MITLRFRECAATATRHPLPLRRLFAQLALALPGEAIELRLPVVLGCAPLGLDPARGLEPLQRRIQRALVDAQHVLGDLLDALRDAPAVQRPERQRLEDQQIERALQQIEFGHYDLPSSALLRHQRPITAGNLRRVQSTIEPSYIRAS